MPVVSITRIMRHPAHYLHRPSQCDRDQCFVCEGGLALCLTCGGAEASMPTDCPQALMGERRAAAVQAGALDYDRRLGWIHRDAAKQHRVRR